MWLLVGQSISHPIGHPTCITKGLSMSLPMDWEVHGIYQNAQNGNLDKMVPLWSMSDQKQGKSYHYWLANIGCPINQPPDIIGCPTCAIHQNNQLDECVKTCHRASSQHHWQLNKTPIITHKEQIKELYDDVFEGIECFPSKPYNINLDKSVTPVQTRCRPVPVHLKEVFEQEINKMLNAGILKPVEKATPWINSFVLVKGKNPDGSIKLRICLDQTNLNKTVICKPYCSKTPEDTAHLLANAKVITVTDCSKGFWHEELDENSSYLTTFNTEFGWFRFTRMPFGVNIAGYVFQCKLDEIFGKLTNVMCIADDIMFVGYKEDHSDHDLALMKLLQTAQKNCVKLNFDKVEYKKHEVTFFGENYTTQGRKPDPKKIKAIVKMKQPENKKEMQTFLGMVQYL